MAPLTRLVLKATAFAVTLTILSVFYARGFVLFCSRSFEKIFSIPLSIILILLLAFEDVISREETVHTLDSHPPYHSMEELFWSEHPTMALIATDDFKSVTLRRTTGKDMPGKVYEADLEEPEQPQSGLVQIDEQKESTPINDRIVSPHQGKMFRLKAGWHLLKDSRQYQKVVRSYAIASDADSLQADLVGQPQAGQIELVSASS